MEGFNTWNITIMWENLKKPLSYISFFGDQEAKELRYKGWRLPTIIECKYFSALYRLNVGNFKRFDVVTEYLSHSIEIGGKVQVFDLYKNEIIVINQDTPRRIRLVKDII